MFQKLPSNYGRKEVYETLNLIRNFRNRINHNEPVCFVNGQLDFSYVRDMYHVISNFLIWIDPVIMSSLQGVDRVLDIIDKEEKKQM